VAIDVVDDDGGMMNGDSFAAFDAGEGFETGAFTGGESQAIGDVNLSYLG
jgi:hypothetical protein